ncbi:PoNe immunity protein domain-containing protein [Hymenobacter norwichensis]|uniref:PoNe immunity protein domain-containing protein n=1 Tax=Hymenobacter norwichensis TaxID=223903 RepID=UPI0003B34F4D|nr:PoNe immunity protein domain-containing protein [Hymenobacter norwichensis]
MQKREPLLTESFFDETIEVNQEEISFYETALLHPEEDMKIELGYFILHGLHYENISLKYSRGYPVEEVKQELLAVIETLEHYKQHPQAEEFFFNGEQDEYMQAVALLSIALLLHVEVDVFRRLADAIGVTGQDYVLEWLVSRRLPERRPTTTKLLFPKTYARLRDALQAPPDLQPQLLRSFLAGWYESLDTVWYNIHAHRTDAAGFTGYWCWEAAAAAYSLGLNDTELQPMRYYPKDLADYAFGRKPFPTP